MADKSENDPQIFVYDTYMRLKSIAPHTTMYIGRQFVYSSAGSLHLDGVRGSISFQKLDLEFFGGSSVSRINPEKIRSFSDFSAFGGRLYYQPRLTTRLGIGWILRETDNQVDYHRLGFDITHAIRNLAILSRASMNPATLQLSEVLLRARINLSQWYFSGEYTTREPSVSYNSIFSLIDLNRYREIRFEAVRKLTSIITAYGTIRTDINPIESSWTGQLGIRTRFASVSWVHQNGYGGDSEGIRGNALLTYGKSWSFYGIINLSRYRVQQEQIDKSDSYSTMVGFRKSFQNNIMVGMEWQYLRNAIQSYDSRFRLRISKGFSNK
ncbi:MAG: hypothetical protein ABIE07_04785 [Candidatus Zixiibacteriota bacterium]